jgi:hypothetical protein
MSKVKKVKVDRKLRKIIIHGTAGPWKVIDLRGYPRPDPMVEALKAAFLINGIQVRDKRDRIDLSKGSEIKDISRRSRAKGEKERHLEHKRRISGVKQALKEEKLKKEARRKQRVRERRKVSEMRAIERLKRQREGAKAVETDEAGAICSACGNRIPEDLLECPECGHEI